ncbi:hypothetical protein L3X38_012904 [Prunus dulcis]|uniref:Uncharacterized protein n=1 Tax=Prunus dulcis TaxID=3755 RepID=A0AAD4WMG2_PRUDU|nr:hypothetical protein L3X38_012904 [Prunus dulcis]
MSHLISTINVNNTYGAIRKCQQRFLSPRLQFDSIHSLSPSPLQFEEATPRRHSNSIIISWPAPLSQFQPQIEDTVQTPADVVRGISL